MEVLSETEAIMYCAANGYKFIKCYMGKQSNEGKLMMLAIDENSNTSKIDIPDELIPEPKDTVIFTIISTGKMYVGKRNKNNINGMVFSADQAVKFTKSEAEVKAIQMSKRGNHYWRTWRMKK